MKPKHISDDWVLIPDHTIQLGEDKALLMLGVRLSDLIKGDMILNHEDVEPINLLPVKTSNGNIVFQQLEDTINKIGVPRLILSDHGSDLHSGINQFLEKHPETSFIYDIKHKTAALLKQILQNDETWKEFTALAAQNE